MTISDINEQQCSYHPDVRTRLRCSKCGKPICPRCAVETPVGYRCPDCAGVRGLPTYQTSSSAVIKSLLLGVLIALAIGVLWGFFPAWNFYLALALGFGVAEGVAWAANYKRGADLQTVAIGSVLFGLIVSRVFIGIDHPFLTVNDLLNNATNPAVLETFQLELIPDVLFAALSVAIAYVRFR